MEDKAKEREAGKRYQQRDQREENGNRFMGRYTKVETRVWKRPQCVVNCYDHDMQAHVHELLNSLTVMTSFIILQTPYKIIYENLI